MDEKRTKKGECEREMRVKKRKKEAKGEGRESMMRGKQEENEEGEGEEGRMRELCKKEGKEERQGKK